MAEENMLTEEEVKQVLDFAYNYYTNGTSQHDPSSGWAYTPYLTNERLSQIGLAPKKLDKKSLEKKFCDPINSQKDMVGYSEYLKLTESVSKRTLLYLGNLPAFDYTFTCINAYDGSDYNTNEYKS